MMRNFNTLEIWGKVILTPRNLGSIDPPKFRVKYGVDPKNQGTYYIYTRKEFKLY